MAESVGRDETGIPDRPNREQRIIERNAVVTAIVNDEHWQRQGTPE